MLQTVHNGEFSRTMELFKEIDDLGDLFLLEKNTKLDSLEGGYEDLQSKYSNLHENYAKEIENSKKVEKCLVKCLKFYSKLCKKYEVQQKIIKDFEESVKEKMNSLEEAQKNEEKMRGLIQVYRTERSLYAGETSTQLRKEKEILLDICCKLISESVTSNSTSNLSSLLLRKFRKDLNDERINLLKSKSIKLKDEPDYDLKPGLGAFKGEMEFKSEDKFCNNMPKVEDSEEDTKNNNLDLSLCEMTTQDSYLKKENSQQDNNITALAQSDREEPGVASSLPPLEELPSSPEPISTDKKDEVITEVSNRIEECYLRLDGADETKPTYDAENAIVTDAETESITESQNVEKFEAPAVNSVSHFDVQEPNESRELPVGPARGSASIFDISDVCPNVSDSSGENKKQGHVSVEPDYLSDVLFESDKPDDLCFISNTGRENVGVENPDEESVFPYENELFKIFREMSSIRFLSPIREPNSSSVELPNVKFETCPNVPTGNKNNGDGHLRSSLKRNSEEENPSKIKKVKLEETESKCCLLDSIMSAMSIQNQEFRAKRFERKESGTSGEISEEVSEDVASLGRRTYSKKSRRDSSKCEEHSAAVCHVPGRSKDRQQAIEKVVTDEIKNFVVSPISSKEDADRNVKHCISALANKSEDVIAKCVVAIVLENVDEPVEVFERPAPPLTKTQHRLIVLLSVIRTLDWDSEKISTKILSIISEKLFPDNFFWPDDCLEAATRFYAALCRARNDTKTLWRFCLNAMTDMRQRCPLVMFTVLQTWPDVLHDASTLKNNLLAVTIANIFLQMPKAEGLRNMNQRRKLAALKHLLKNFYQFQVDDTIEGHAKKVLEAVRREELGAEKSVVLLSKCRDPSWTVKNVVPALQSSLVDWLEGRVGDSAASTILSVIKQICPLLLQGDNSGGKVKELALCLSEILTSRKKSHDSEVNLVEVLLKLKQYSEIRKVICEWVPKNAIGDSLRNQIINASADNILRELKLNRKKEAKNFSAKMKQWKKSKGKKKKGRKRKKNEQKQRKEESTGISSKN